MVEKFQKSPIVQTGADSNVEDSDSANSNEDSEEEYIMFPLASYISVTTYHPTSGAYQLTKYPASISRTYAPPPASVIIPSTDTLNLPPISVSCSPKKIVSLVFPGLLVPKNVLFSSQTDIETPSPAACERESKSV